MYQMQLKKCHLFVLHCFGKIKDSIAHMGPNELTLFSRFSSNRATRPIQSSSRDVRLSSCLMSPSHAIFCVGELVHALLVRELVYASVADAAIL